jgi:hypothetical protein
MCESNCYLESNYQFVLWVQKAKRHSHVPASTKLHGSGRGSLLGGTLLGGFLGSLLSLTLLASDLLGGLALGAALALASLAGGSTGATFGGHDEKLDVFCSANKSKPRHHKPETIQGRRESKCIPKL